MKAVSEKSWKTLLLVSIITALSLLGAFKISGLMDSTGPIQTVDVQPTTLNVTRPGFTTGVFQEADNFYNSDSVTANFTVQVNSFLGVGDSDSPLYELLQTYLTFSATTTGGEVKSVNLSFNWTNPNDTAFVYANYQYGGGSLPQNLTLTSIYAGKHSNTHDAVVTTLAEPNKNGCYMFFYVTWYLNVNDNQDHQLNYTAQLAYQDENGTLRSLNIPINVGLLLNRNVDFNSAKEIGLGLYNPTPFRIIMGGESDYYKFKVESGKSYNITVTPTQSTISPGGILNLYVYNKTQDILNFSGVHSTPQAAFAYSLFPEVYIGPMSYSGYTYIRVECYSGDCPYTLNINPLQTP